MARPGGRTDAHGFLVATCTLQVGERVVLLSNGGPPEAEYVLFDPGEIELAASEPGTVREVGYRTIAEEASRRLEDAGITPDLAREAASAVAPSLAASYARGSAARRVASLLGPAELFDGAVYDHELRRYEGRWLDLPALGLDVELSRATTLLQALSLCAALEEVDPDTRIVLNTREHSLERRPGERSYRRVSFENAAHLPDALRSLAARDRGNPRRAGDAGPTRDDLLAVLRDRVDACSDPRARDRISLIAGAMQQRQRPSRGPLADAELWSLEEQLVAGNAFGVIERLDAIDRRVGRHPATAYLRVRASLVGQLEPARAVAERATALAMSMTSFGECELLAAEAWMAAGEARRALPFARDLMSNPNAHEELRARALRIVETAEHPDRVDTAPPPPVSETLRARTSTRPPPPPASSPLSLEESFDLAPISRPPPRRSSNAALDLAPSRPSRPPSYPTAPFPRASQGPLSSPRTSAVDPARARSSPLSVPVPGGIPLRSTRYASAPEARRITPQAIPVPEARIRRAEWALDALMQGASLPPYRSDSPTAHVHVPRAPRLPFSTGPSELATALALPPGIGGVAPSGDTLPVSVLDARVHFTFLARELAREYRDEAGVELRMDVSCVEAIQAQVLERYPDRRITTVTQAIDVARHGALLSEILARTLDAFWVDVAPTDLGYWAMIVPPSTRVWPFGRILRLIEMQRQEWDLVAYYLDLQSRAT